VETGTLGDLETETIAPTLDGSKLPHGVPGELPDGTYRLTVVHDDIAALDLPADIADFAIPENVGTYTWRLEAGRWHMDQATSPAPVVPSLDGTYVVAGDVVTFYFPSGMTMSVEQASSDAMPPAPIEKFRWSVADGALSLTALDGTDPLAAATMAAHSWQPVAAAAV
jgi:hypothetical protein